MTSFAATVVADHRQLQASRAKYDARYQSGVSTSDPVSIFKDFVTHIGFQQLTVFRMAAAFHRRGLTPLAMLLTRLIRHLYGAEMHYGADLAPGVLLVHGNGLVISREARVERGCVLSQHVTLGLSSGPNRTAGGAPHLLRDVHVAPGAVLLGPISVGPNSKIAANAVVMDSVPEGFVVTAAPTVATARRSSSGPTEAASR